MTTLARTTKAKKELNTEGGKNSSGKRSRQGQCQSEQTSYRHENHPLLHLERTHGNQAVQRLLHERIQPKLEVGQSDDRYEREADQVAKAVLSDSVSNDLLKERSPEIRRNTTTGQLSRLPVGSSGLENDVFAQSIQSLRGSGYPLPVQIRDEFESKFGSDFSAVRIHTDSRAAEAARMVNARAFTLGPNIVFGDKEYQPGSDSGRHLLAHELTHTIQQGPSNGIPTGQIANQTVVQTRMTEPIVQRDIIGRALGAVPLGPLNTSMLDLVWNTVMSGFRASAKPISIPARWKSLVVDFAEQTWWEGVLLQEGLSQSPSYWRGGGILDIQKNAGAITLDRDVFVDGKLSLMTYVHELVHVGQYSITGKLVFLGSYFGLSALTILKRWLRGEPIEIMQSSPHENMAYGIAKRFAKWYASTHHGDAESEKI